MKNAIKVKELRNSLRTALNEIDNITGIPKGMSLVRDNFIRKLYKKAVFPSLYDDLFDESKCIILQSINIADPLISPPVYLFEDLLRLHYLISSTNNTTRNSVIYENKTKRQDNVKFSNVIKFAGKAKIAPAKRNQQHTNLTQLIRQEKGINKIVALLMERLSAPFEEIYEQYKADSIKNKIKPLEIGKQRETRNSVHLHTPRKEPVKSFLFYTIKRERVSSSVERNKKVEKPPEQEAGSRLGTEENNSKGLPQKVRLHFLFNRTEEIINVQVVLKHLPRKSLFP